MLPMRYCFLFLLLAQVSSFGATCGSLGGVCSACGTYYYCTGGGLGGRAFTAAGCLATGPLAGGCYNTTSDLTCICAGCDVQVTGGTGVAACMSAGCGGACAGIPELPGEGSGRTWLMIFGSGLIALSSFALKKFLPRGA